MTMITSEKGRHRCRFLRRRVRSLPRMPSPRKRVPMERRSRLFSRLDGSQEKEVRLRLLLKSWTILCDTVLTLSTTKATGRSTTRISKAQTLLSTRTNTSPLRLWSTIPNVRSQRVRPVDKPIPSQTRRVFSPVSATKLRPTNFPNHKSRLKSFPSTTPTSPASLHSITTLATLSEQIQTMQTTMEILISIEETLLSLIWLFPNLLCMEVDR